MVVCFSHSEIFYFVLVKFMSKIMKYATSFYLSHLYGLIFYNSSFSFNRKVQRFSVDSLTPNNSWPPVVNILKQGIFVTIDAPIDTSLSSRVYSLH